jgi:hypothetical protein
VLPGSHLRNVSNLNRAKLEMLGWTCCAPPRAQLYGWFRAGPWTPRTGYPGKSLIWMKPWSNIHVIDRIRFQKLRRGRSELHGPGSVLTTYEPVVSRVDPILNPLCCCGACGPPPVRFVRFVLLLQSLVKEAFAEWWLRDSPSMELNLSLPRLYLHLTFSYFVKFGFKLWVWRQPSHHK